MASSRCANGKVRFSLHKCLWCVFACLLNIQVTHLLYQAGASKLAKRLKTCKLARRCSPSPCKSGIPSCPSLAKTWRKCCRRPCGRKGLGRCPPVHRGKFCIRHRCWLEHRVAMASARCSCPKKLDSRLELDWWEAQSQLPRPQWKLGSSALSDLELKLVPLLKPRSSFHCLAVRPPPPSRQQSRCIPLRQTSLRSLHRCLS
mmetsp:Transcript_39034/g.83064  ORF Transcript_39034/g.83064 Transcript_39034/m.83064 type:complete len:202 (+) Transcript_39034:68-673(+)